MATKEATLTIEKAPIDADGKLEQRQNLLKALKTKLENFEKELDGKTYLIEGKEVTAKKLREFIAINAEWKFSEALGIIQGVKDLDDCIQALSSGKRKELMLSVVSIEAVYYFLSKETGKGLVSAKEYLDMLKPVSDALSRAKVDKDKKDQLVRDIASVESAIEQGVATEHEEKLLAEIEADHITE